MVEGAERPRGRRLLHIHVVQDDQRRVAPQFEVDALQMPRCRCRDRFSGPRGSGEGDHGHLGVIHQCRADVSAPRQYVQQAAGEPRLLENPRDHHTAADRGPGVGLEDDGVSQSQRRSHRSHRQHHRCVERGDHTDNADRAPTGERQPVLHGAEHLPERRRGQCRGFVALLRCAVGGLEVCECPQRSRLPHDPVGDLGVMLFEQARSTPQDLCPFDVRQRRPLLLRPHRLPHGPAQVVGRGSTDTTQRLAGRRLERVVRFARTLDPLAGEDPFRPVACFQKRHDVLLLIR
ncbi:hypothetical protein SMA5143A_8108 [Streptomyces sp. MA5143a]|nr:hypothetical protein SMA5143A_8108 [Streptomyces sp. MA5143a]